MTRRALLKLTVVGLLMAGCTTSTDATPASVAASEVAPNPVGRTVCAGSVRDATAAVPGAGADAIERLQNTYEGDAGFLAVIWEGGRPVVIVERGHLAAWKARLGPVNIAVAPSCIDPALLALVHQALPRISVQPGGAIGGGYNALDDAIVVAGVDTDVLLAQLEALQQGARDAAAAAIAAGTLRINEASTGGVRQ